MNSLGDFTSFITYDVNQYNNPFFLIYLCSGLLLFFSILSLYGEKRPKFDGNKLLHILEEVSYDDDTLEKCRKVLFPDKGEVVTLLNGKWRNLIGHITRYNYEDNSYNIKVYKSDNPDTNQVPKRRIFRNRIDFVVNPEI